MMGKHEPDAGPETAGSALLRSGGNGIRLTAVLLGAAALILGIALFFALYLPAHAEKAVEKAAERLSEPGIIEFKVLSASLRSARLACTVYGQKEHAGEKVFFCDDIRIRYSPRQVSGGKLSSISLSNAFLTVFADSSGVSAPALSVFKRKFFRPGKARIGDTDSAFAFSARKLDFSGTVTMAARGREIARVPLCGTLRPDPSDGWHFIRGDFSAPDRGNLSCGYNLRKNELDCAGSFSFRLFPLLADSLLLQEKIPGFCPEELLAEVRVSKLALALSGVSPWKLFQAAEVHFSVSSGKSLLLEQGCAVYDPARSELSGSAVLHPAKNPVLPFRFLLKKGAVASTLQAESLPPEERRERDFSVCGISFRDPVFSLKAQFDAATSASPGADRKETSSSWQFELSCARFRAGPLGAGRAVLTGKSSSGAAPQILFRMTNAALNGKTFSFYAPHACFGWLPEASSGKSVRFFSAEKGSLEIPSLRLKGSGISFRCSDDPHSPDSRFRTGEIRLNARLLGSFSGRAVCKAVPLPECLSADLFLLPESVRVDGAAECLGQQGRFSVTASPNGGGKASLALDFPRRKLTDGARPVLEFFLPEIDSAQLEGFASFQFSAVTGQKAKGRFSLDSASFRMPGKALTVNGLSIAMDLTGLPARTTRPGQKFAFDSLSSGPLSLEKGRGVFRIDPDGAFRIESFRASWCGGDLFLPGGVFPPRGASMTAVCGNLLLPDLLTQLGIGNFTGEGRVSGELSFIFSSKSKGAAAFADGIFYSLPGEGGTLKGSLRKTLLESANAAGERHPGISFAYETLQDMAYRWVRMEIGTDKDGQARLFLRFNGSPQRPLPYMLDRENNRILRTGKPQMIRGSLLLNLNNLPFRFGNLGKLETHFRH